MTVRIGPPEPETVGGLVECWVALAEDQRKYGSHLLAGENREQVRQSMARHLVMGGLLIAVEDEREELVGFVMFGPETGSYETDCTRGIVHNLYVRPEWRDEGVGTELLDSAEELLTIRGMDVVSLEAMADNEAARRFYERNGYRPHRVQFEKSIQNDTHSNE